MLQLVSFWETLFSNEKFYPGLVSRDSAKLHLFVMVSMRWLIPFAQPRDVDVGKGALSVLQLVPSEHHTDHPTRTDINPACRLTGGPAVTSCRGADRTIAAQPCAEMDDIDRIAAHYLVHRLGVEATGYVRRVIRRFVETGQSDKAAAWAAIATAVAAEQHRPKIPPGERQPSRGA